MMRCALYLLMYGVMCRFPVQAARLHTLVHSSLLSLRLDAGLVSLLLAVHAYVAQFVMINAVDGALHLIFSDSLSFCVRRTSH